MASIELRGNSYRIVFRYQRRKFTTGRSRPTVAESSSLDCRMRTVENKGREAERLSRLGQASMN